MGTADPKAMPTPENKANDAFANVLKGVMGGKDAPGGTDLGTWIQNTFKLPGYAGQIAAPQNAAEVSAGAQGKSAVDSYFAGGGAGEHVNASLTSMLDAPAVTPDSVMASLKGPEDQRLKATLGQLQEQFGVQGLSNSSSLHEAGTRAAVDSNQNLAAAVTQILPQLKSAETASKGTAAQLLAQLPIGVAKSGFDLGEAGRQVDQQGMDRMIQEFLRSNSLFPMLLQYLGGTPQQPYAPSTFSNVMQAGTTAAAIAKAV